MAKKKRKKCKDCRKSSGKEREITSEQFLVGLMLGGGATYILSDENLRRQVMRYAMQTFGSIAQSVEELKEQFADIQAEIAAEQAVQS